MAQKLIGARVHGTKVHWSELTFKNLVVVSQLKWEKTLRCIIFVVITYTYLNDVIRTSYIHLIAFICLRGESGVSEGLDVNVGFREGCLMSPWLFNMYMDGVVGEVNEVVLGR